VLLLAHRSGAGPRHGAGLGALQVAEETVLPLGGLAFTGRKFEDIRTALNHARKQGITAEWISFPTAPLASQAADTSTNLRAPTDRGHCQECGEQRAQQNHLHEL